MTTTTVQRPRLLPTPSLPVPVTGQGRAVTAVRNCDSDLTWRLLAVIGYSDWLTWLAAVIAPSYAELSVSFRPWHDVDERCRELSLVFLFSVALLFQTSALASGPLIHQSHGWLLRLLLVYILQTSMVTSPDGMIKWVERMCLILGDREIQTLWVWMLVESNQWL